jgi:hypothetical protein
MKIVIYCIKSCSFFLALKLRQNDEKLEMEKAAAEEEVCFYLYTIISISYIMELDCNYGKVRRKDCKYKQDYS